MKRVLSMMMAAVLVGVIAGCSCEDEIGSGRDSGVIVYPDGRVVAIEGGAGIGDGGSGGRDGSGEPRVIRLELWLTATSGKLVHIPISAADGSFGAPSVSTVERVDGLFFRMLTQMQDGSLVAGATPVGEGPPTTLFHIRNPPRDGSAASAQRLGNMADDIVLEALYTDCEDRLYGMDTGANVSSSEGNRLLRFSGRPLNGDLQFTVVSDLSSASVADIDDMGPGIDAQGELTDNPGFAIDTSNIHDFNYETGSGTRVGGGGKFGIHVLGGELFDDGKSRLYVSLDTDATVHQLDWQSFEVIDTVSTGLDERVDALTGPLTNCTTGFVLR